eukprot:GEMP01027139.1.p1 GENE.GEMP01027139.1~~GEMP01027139.1.p1  ORF type:complete len:469 (+),score=102.18 GEMP01027139.1:489-1895(+)
MSPCVAPKDSGADESMADNDLATRPPRREIITTRRRASIATVEEGNEKTDGQGAFGGRRPTRRKSISWWMVAKNALAASNRMGGSSVGPLAFRWALVRRYGNLSSAWKAIGGCHKGTHGRLSKEKFIHIILQVVRYGDHARAQQLWLQMVRGSDKGMSQLDFAGRLEKPWTISALRKKLLLYHSSLEGALREIRDHSGSAKKVDKDMFIEGLAGFGVSEVAALHYIKMMGVGRNDIVSFVEFEMALNDIEPTELLEYFSRKFNLRQHHGFLPFLSEYQFRNFLPRIGISSGEGRLLWKILSPANDMVTEESMKNILRQFFKPCSDIDTYCKLATLVEPDLLCNDAMAISILEKVCGLKGKRDIVRFEHFDRLSAHAGVSRDDSARFFATIAKPGEDLNESMELCELVEIVQLSSPFGDIKAHLASVKAKMHQVKHECATLAAAGHKSVLESPKRTPKRLSVFAIPWIK